MTGIFNLRPPKPKLSFVWDEDILFRYFEQQGDNCLLSEIILTQKLIICCFCCCSRRNKHDELTTDQLITTLRKPFKGVSIYTIRRWIKDIFTVNNIIKACVRYFLFFHQMIAL